VRGLGRNNLMFYRICVLDVIRVKSNKDEMCDTRGNSEGTQRV